MSMMENGKYSEKKSLKAKMRVTFADILLV